MFKMCFQYFSIRKIWTSSLLHCGNLATPKLRQITAACKRLSPWIRRITQKPWPSVNFQCQCKASPVFLSGSSWFKHNNICFNHQPTNIANVCTCSMYHPSLSHCHGCHEIFLGHVLHPSRGPSWRGLLQHLSLHRFWSSTRNLGALGSGDLYVNLKLSDEHPDCDWCFSRQRRHQHGFLMLGG